MSNNPLNRGLLLEMASGFWASRVLHAAVNLEIFTRLSGKSLSLEEAGFQEIEARPFAGPVSLITGVK